MNATRSVIVKSPKKKETPVHASWCFSDLKAQAALMITCLDERSHRIVLEQKYLINQSYGTIANNLYVSKTTIHNWIHEAMDNLLLPENPICIYERNERNERR